MGGHWKKEKEAISKIREIKEKFESTKTEAQLAERQGDLSRAAELKYGTLIALEKNLEQEKRIWTGSADQKMLKEEVDSEDIAEVVGKWTGIPVSRLMEGERRSSSEWKTGSRACDRPEEGNHRCGQCGAQGPLPASRIPTAHRVLYFHGAHGRGQDRVGPCPGGVPV